MLIAVNQATGEKRGLPPISARRTALFSMPVECGNRLAAPFFRVPGRPKIPKLNVLKKKDFSLWRKRWIALKQSPFNV